MLANFVSEFKLELMYILLIVNKTSLIKPYSSSWFSAACATVIFHRNRLFHLQQQNTLSESKGKFRQVRSCCKRIFEAAKFEYPNKAK